MGSLGAYIEGMADLCLPFTAINSSNLAAWPDLALWPTSNDAHSSCMLWCFPILLRLMQHCIRDPWGALGHILKEWRTSVSPSQRSTAQIWLPGQIWHFGPLRMMLTPLVCYGASQFFYS